MKHNVLLLSGIVKSIEGSGKFDSVVNWLFTKMENNDAAPFAPYVVIRRSLFLF